MPFVEVKVAGPLKEEQRKDIIKGITELLHKVANKNPATTNVVITEHPRNTWGVGGDLLSDKDKISNS